MRGGEEVVAVGRVARRARGGGAHAVRRRSSSSAPRYSRSTRRCASIASGASARVRVDALTEAGDAHPPVERARAWRRGAVPSTSATSRRTEFVPMSTAATPRHDPRRPRPACRPVEASRDPRADGVVAAGEEVRRSGRGGTSRPCGCRRRRRTGAGPAWPGGDRRRRARPRTARGRRASASGSTAASAARTPPAASSRRPARLQVGVDEPVARGHRRAVAGERRVADHDRRAGGVAHDDLEVGAAARGRAAR